MIRREYYTLIASLPPLKKFDQAERLPINMERLRERLTILGQEDAKLVDSVASFIIWHRQPMERSDKEMFVVYKQLIESIDNPMIKEMINLRIDIRTIVVALRRRYRGLPAPKSGELWGMGRWVQHIEKYWDDQNLRLAAVYPWIPQVREYLENGNALELERLQMNQVWEGVDRLEDQNYFGIDVIFSYLFKWDMMQRWLANDVESAKVRFDELVSEVISDQGI
jgi:hypothetical protein